MINRDIERYIEIIWCTEMYTNDLSLANSFDKPEAIMPQVKKRVTKEDKK